MKIPIFIIVVVLATACTRNRADQVSNTAVPAAPRPACQAAQLSDEVKNIATVTKGPVGAAFALLGTQEGASIEGDRHFPMQSVYKFPIAMLVLQQVDAGKLSLDQHIAVKPADFVSDREFTIARDYPRGAELSVREFLRYMISESDGTACDVLLRLNGVTTATNDIGIISLPDGGQLAVAVFVSDTRADEKVREEVIAKIAEAGWKCWVR